MPEFDIVFITLVTGSFVAAVFNAAFSAGGALIILALTSTVLPVSAVVPIHSTLLIGSTGARVLLFRQYIEWQLVLPFLVGSLLGALLGARLYFELPEQLIATSIAVLMLIAIWLPQVSWRPNVRQPWLIVGFGHALLSTLFAYGAILQTVILHTKLSRRQIVGTVGGCLTGMAVFKISGYVFNGFDYKPYFYVIAASVVVSFFGTWLGRKFVDRVSERVFRIAFRLLVTVTALRLIAVNVFLPS